MLNLNTQLNFENLFLVERKFSKKNLALLWSSFMNKGSHSNESRPTYTYIDTY